MDKLTKYLVKDLISEADEWWTDMSVGAQKDYISKYDTSKSLDASNPSGKKERGTKNKNQDVLKKILEVSEVRMLT